MLSVASVQTFLWSVMSIEYCVVCGEYRNLVLSVASVQTLWSVMSIESCVFCGEYKMLCCLGRV